MTKSCRSCQASFEITDDDLKFYDKISPVFNGKKYPVPPPLLCPLCRMQRRQAYRNDRSLYSAKSSLSGKEMIAMYHPAKKFTVYEYKEWWSGQWDPLEYGQAYDPSQDIFTQIVALRQQVPRFNLFNSDTENCDYVNYAPHCKNCYLLFGAWFNEDCFYGQTFNESKNCIDGLFVDKSELCYESVDASGNYAAFFCQSCSNVTESYFCYDCQNVRNCIGCYNLRNKEYYIENRPATKEEYEKIKASLGSYQVLQSYRNRYRDTAQKHAVHKFYHGANNENVSGDFIFNCKNAKFCFSSYRSQDIAYTSRMFDQKDTYDFEGGGKGELVYEGMSNDFSYMSMGCMTCEHMKDSHYCDHCFNCTNCFGCIGLQHKEYCIFNKQYTKEEYNILLPQIIEKMTRDGQWGEFFPVHLSPFGYNETIAQDYFPLTKEAALQKGFNWTDYEPPKPDVAKIIPASKLPDNIKDIPDDILNWAIECEVTKRPFRIIKQELQFYRDHNLPVPRRHPDQRHKDRMALRNPRKLYNRTCVKCNQPIQTTYSPERPEKVYCEACYLKEVY